MSGRRLSEGGRIDRTVSVHFRFNGRRLRGLRGDTLASALLAEGVDVVGRSFKYSRPRGIVGCGAEEPNAIVQLGRGESSVPNLRATQVELYEGLDARSVSGGSGPGFGSGAVLGVVLGAVGRLLPPGFYYKTFMHPRPLWRFAEHFIRRAAGLGHSPAGADPDRYDKLHRHCDVLVVGAGPAGLQAALAAAASGARVIVADEQNEFGGSLLASRARVDGLPAAEWVARTAAQLAACERVQALPRSTVFGYYDHNFLGILERRTDHLALCGDGQVRQRLHRVRARQVVLAAGATERPLVFSGNDLPGVMLASAVSTYLQRYAVAAGERLVLFTAHDRAYQTAIDWLEAGRELVVVVDSRPRPDGELAAAAKGLGARIIAGHGVIEARGRKRVRAVRIAPLNRAGDALTGPARTLRCDLLASSGGYSPAVHLSSHTGARPRWSREAAAFVPGEAPRGARSAGAAAGRFDLAECLRDGAAAGLAAAEAAGFETGGAERGAAPDVAGERAEPPPPLFLVPHVKPCSRAPAQFVDLQLDVTAADIELAAREGYTSIEHTKRYTALGFGTDQGKLGNVNGVAILSRARGQTIAETGTTMFRPPYTPVAFGALAGGDVGELFDPERYTAMHRWHEEHGAVWENVGQWKRPRYYPRPGESMREAVDRECLAVRRGVGMLDGSTLGKIDIQGPDAAEFLSRIYTSDFRGLAPGRCRYGLMLGEDGMIFDDGVTACLAENRYLTFTTTGGAAAVLAHLESWLQTEWPRLRVYCTSVTDHWAVIAVAGPRAREVLRRVSAGVDLEGDAFRFMVWRDGVVAGVDARIFRVSFSGELSFEINVPAHYGRYVWERLMEAGAEFGITPYGTEAMHVLRAEKGFIIVGQDTDGSVTPLDAGMAWALDKDPPFSYLGRRSLQRSDCVRPDRKQLVGLRSVDDVTVLPEGAQIVDRPGRPPLPMQGHVTSSYFSAHLEHPIALALVKGGRGRLGEVVHCPLADGRCVAARIVDPVFYDAKGERQRV